MTLQYKQAKSSSQTRSTTGQIMQNARLVNYNIYKKQNQFNYTVSQKRKRKRYGKQWWQCQLMNRFQEPYFIHPHKYCQISKIRPDETPVNP